MSSIFLFTGENSYALREKKRLWVQEFAKKHGQENLQRLSAKECTFRTLLDEIAVAPFIAENRLVVVDGVPKLAKEEVTALPEHLHPQVILLFVDPKPDKRLSGTKELLKVATVEECNPLRGAALQKWIGEQVSLHGCSIAPDAQKLLLDTVGEDQDFLSQEIAKLSLYCDGRQITSDDVSLLTICCGEQQVWGLMDLIGQGKSAEALAYIRRLQEQGENAHGLWSILLWMFSSIAPVASAVSEGVTNAGAITKQTGVSFGSAKSLLPLVRKKSAAELQEIVCKVADFDVALKTGGYKATGESPEELEAIIDRMILATVN